MSAYTVVIVGAGGNIGSHVVAHIARLAGIRRIVLVDPDYYSEGNLRGQDMRRRDVGRPKVSVQARRIREIAPKIAIEAVMASVENVPLGHLRADVMLSCVDSRAARRAINALAWRLGVRWIDAGVNGPELLARVNAYTPGPEQVCYLCSWDDRAYETLEQAYPCLGDATPSAPATNAPSALGALAAALQALECQKLLAGELEHVAVAKQVTVCARTHRELVTTFRPNPRCRFDHDVWQIDRLVRRADECTVAQALELGRRAVGCDAAVAMKVVDQVFARRLTCLGCGTNREFQPYLFGRLGRTARTCERCGGTMRVAGFDVLEWLRAPELPASVRDASLKSLGVRTGDVLSFAEGERTLHFELGAST